MSFDLISEINDNRAEIQYVLENWGYESLTQLMEMEGAAMARQGEREWGQSLGQKWGSEATPARHQSNEPQPGDVVQYQGRLFMLGDLNPQTGEFATTVVGTGRPGTTFLSKFLRTKFQPQAGQDGHSMWSLPGQ